MRLNDAPYDSHLQELQMMGGASVDFVTDIYEQKHKELKEAA